VQFARNNVASAERNLINQKLSREEAARSLELLLGKYPSGQFGSGNELPTMKKNVPAGLPSELLLRRPDLISAAAAVRASSQRAEASMKDLLPSFSLTGRGSNSSRKLDQFILDPETIVWSAATSLAQTLFRAGAQRASARIALQQNERSIRRFSSEILRALREVESALATEKSLAEQNKYLSTELRQAELAEKQAMRDYSEGLIRIISVLEAQRRAVASRRAMIFLKNQRIQNRIDLHLALGGSFN
jgi:outer membrane protein TolC